MTALVQDGRLTVELDGTIPPGWKKHLRRTFHSLDTSTWDAIRVKKTTLTVNGVRAGSEERLRHLLESALTQANSQTPSTDDDEAEAEAPEVDADVEMTARFRSFAA